MDDGPCEYWSDEEVSAYHEGQDSRNAELAALQAKLAESEARVGHLEAECAKLRRLVSEAYRDGFAAGCFPNANVDDAWPQSMTFADLNAETNHD